MTIPTPVASLIEKLQAQGKMRPRWVFVLEQVAIGMAIALVAVGLVYFGSLLSYLWHRAEFSSLPQFGPGGVRLLINAFPWWQAALIVVGVVAFVYLLQRHTHLYRWPLSISLGVFLVAFVGAAWLANLANLHEHLRVDDSYTSDGRVPWFRPHGPLTRSLITDGIVTETKNGTIKIRAGDEIITVKITRDTMFEPDWEPQIGEEVVVIGKHSGNTIRAVGVRPANVLPRRPPFRIYRDGHGTYLQIFQFRQAVS